MGGHMAWYWLLFFGGIPSIAALAFVVSLIRDIRKRRRGDRRQRVEMIGGDFVTFTPVWPVLAWLAVITVVVGTAGIVLDRVL